MSGTSARSSGSTPTARRGPSTGRGPRAGAKVARTAAGSGGMKPPLEVAGPDDDEDGD